MSVFIDTLNPPSPSELVQDMEAAGAVAVGLYVLRRDAPGNLLGNGAWTPAHVAAVFAAGKYVLPIVVPGNAPRADDWKLALDNAHALGVPVGLIDVDLEQYSEPVASWVGDFIRNVRAAGWRCLRYGDIDVLARYPVGDGDWVSHGLIPVRAGNWQPVPPLPAGCVMDQYCVQAVINGHGYDVSVAAEGLFGDRPQPVGGDMVIDSAGIRHLAAVGPAGNIFYVHGPDLTASPTEEDWGGEAEPFSAEIGIGPDGTIEIYAVGPTGIVSVNRQPPSGPRTGWQATPAVVALPADQAQTPDDDTAFVTHAELRAILDQASKDA